MDTEIWSKETSNIEDTYFCFKHLAFLEYNFPET